MQFERELNGRFLCILNALFAYIPITSQNKPMTPKYMRDLRRKMDDSFNEEELSGLAFDLAVDWEHLAGRTKPEKIRSLISHQSRRGDLGDLIEIFREERPDETWEDLPPKEQQIEDAQAALTDKERDAALETYLSNIREYIAQQEPDPTSIAMVQALTDKVWPYLDRNRRNIVIRLLIKTKLFCNLTHSHRNLRGADLTFLDFSRADFQVANLSDTNLSNSNFISANLFQTNLTRACLYYADLTGANLTSANLTSAFLFNVDLCGANLHNAIVLEDQLRNAKLDTNTTMPSGEKWGLNGEA